MQGLPKHPKLQSSGHTPLGRCRNDNESLPSLGRCSRSKRTASLKKHPSTRVTRTDSKNTTNRLKSPYRDHTYSETYSDAPAEVWPEFVLDVAFPSIRSPLLEQKSTYSSSSSAAFLPQLSGEAQEGSRECEYRYTSDSDGYDEYNTEVEEELNAVINNATQELCRLTPLDLENRIDVFDAISAKLQQAEYALAASLPQRPESHLPFFLIHPEKPVFIPLIDTADDTTPLIGLTIDDDRSEDLGSRGGSRCVTPYSARKSLNRLDLAWVTGSLSLCSSSTSSISDVIGPQYITVTNYSGENGIADLPFDILRIIVQFVENVSFVIEGLSIDCCSVLAMRSTCWGWRSSIDAIPLNEWLHLSVLEGVPFNIPSSTSMKRRKERELVRKRMEEERLRAFDALCRSSNADMLAELYGEDVGDTDEENGKAWPQTSSAPVKRRWSLTAAGEQEHHSENVEPFNQVKEDKSEIDLTDPTVIIRTVLKTLSRFKFHSTVLPACVGSAMRAAAAAAKPRPKAEQDWSNSTQNFRQTLTELAPCYVLKRVNVQCPMVDWVTPLLKRQLQIRSFRVFGMNEFRLTRSWRGCRHLDLEDLCVEPTTTSLTPVSQLMRVEFVTMAIAFLDATLKRSHNLRELHLPHHIFGNAACRIIANHCKQLEGLTIHDWSGPPVRDQYDHIDVLDDNGVQILMASLTKLRRLSLQGLCRFTSKGMECIFKNGENLEALCINVNGQRPTQGDWYLAPLPHLRMLRLIVNSDDRILFDAIARACPNVTTLCCRHWLWFPNCVRAVAYNMPSLTTLLLEGPTAEDPETFTWVKENTRRLREIYFWPKSDQLAMALHGVNLVSTYSRVVDSPTLKLLDDQEFTRFLLERSGWGAHSWALAQAMPTALRLRKDAYR